MKVPPFSFPLEQLGARLSLPLTKGEARRGLKEATAVVY